MKLSSLIFAFVLSLATLLHAQTWKSAASQAVTAMNENRFAEAVTILDTAIQSEPNQFRLYCLRAECFSKLKKIDESVQNFDQAITLTPADNQKDLAMIYYGKARALKRANRPAEAVPMYEKAMTCNPQDPMPRNDLAWILATTSDSKVRNSKRALQISLEDVNREQWKNPVSLDTLAAAYAAEGKFEEAIRIEEKILTFELGEEDKAGCKARLELYKKNQAYFEP